MPIANKTYGASLNEAQSTRAPVFRGGMRDFIPILQIRRHVSWMNAKLRIVHGNPIFGRSCCTIAGKIMPPVALPAAAIPMAKLLFVLK